MEIGFSANCGNADAITIAAYTCDHTSDKSSCFGVINISETQSVEIGDRSRAHGEYIAQDSANARRRSLVWFDE